MYLLILFLYFSIPKVNLIEIGNYGIRLQDVLSIAMAFRVFSHIRILRLLDLRYIPYVFLMLILGSQLDIQDAVLDMFRLLQYVIIGIFFAIVISKNNRILDIIIITQLAFALLQFLMLVPNFDTGRGAIFSTKYSGTFGVSSEFTYSMILLLLMRYKSFVSRLFLTSLFVLNGTTTALLVYISIFKNINKKYNLIIFLLAIFGSFLLPLVFFDISLNDLFGREAKSIYEIKSFSEGNFEGGDYLSLIHRSTKALGIIDVFVSNPQYTILGLGFGAVFTPADFGFLRLFANFGIIGLISFYLFFRKLPTELFFAVVIANLLFDGLWSSTVGPICFGVYFLYTGGMGLFLSRKIRRVSAFAMNKP